MVGFESLFLNTTRNVVAALIFVIYHIYCFDTLTILHITHYKRVVYMYKKSAHVYLFNMSRLGSGRHEGRMELADLFLGASVTQGGGSNVRTRVCGGEGAGAGKGTRLRVCFLSACTCLCTCIQPNNVGPHFARPFLWHRRHPRC